MTGTRMTFCFIISLLILAGGSAFAGTDLISNALTQSNSFLKEAGLVQKEYSGIARKLVTGKVSIDLDELGGEKIQKMKEKAESVKEKAEKLQDRIETAKERKEELVAKYNELNAKALEYQAKAEEYIAEGQAIKEQYMTYKKEALDMVDDIKDAKDKIEEELNPGDEVDTDTGDTAKDEISGAKEQMEEACADPESEACSQATEAYNQAVAATDAEEQAKEAAVAASQAAAAAGMAAETSVSNRADAIRSAAVLAESSSADVSATARPAVTAAAVEAALPQQVSVADVMASASTAEAEQALPAAESYSPLNLQEQLLQASAQNNAVNSAVSAVKLVDDADASAGISSARSKFTSKEAGQNQSLVQPQVQMLQEAAIPNTAAAVPSAVKMSTKTTAAADVSVKPSVTRSRFTAAPAVRARQQIQTQPQAQTLQTSATKERINVQQR